MNGLLFISVVWATWLAPCASPSIVGVVEEEKCVGNAEEAVDDALDADTSKMICVRGEVVVVNVDRGDGH